MADLISRKQVLNASHFVACWDGVEHFSLEVVDADFIQKLPSVQPTQSNAQSTQFNALDCISRQEAIEAVRSYYDECDTSYKSIEERIEDLPSAHPTQSNAQSTQINTLDCVSRESVLDAIDKYILGKPEGCTVEVRELLKLITKVYHMPIYRMSSAQTEQKKGIWLSKNLPICIGAKELVEVYICSNCGHVVDGNDLSNFCSVCGCDMRSESDE